MANGSNINLAHYYVLLLHELCMHVHINGGCYYSIGFDFCMQGHFDVKPSMDKVKLP